MAQPEQRILGVTVKCRGRTGVDCGVSTFLCVVGCGGSWVCAGAWWLAVIVTSSEEQSVGAWLVGSMGSLSAKCANGLLLRVTHQCRNWVAQMQAQKVELMEVVTFCG